MSIINRIIKKSKDIAAIPYRKKINSEMQKKLINKSFSIISNNCNGCIFTHDLGQQFRTPTVNLFFEAEDFVRFCENLSYYISLIPEEDKKQTAERGYPVSKLGDLSLYCVHYSDFNDFLEKWESRKKRINYDNLFLMVADRNGFTDKMVERLSVLNYPKVFYSRKPMPNYDFVCYVPGFENDSQVGQLHFYADYKGNRYYEKYFDLVRWLNEKI